MEKVTITIERYNELLRKEFVYDAKKAAYDADTYKTSEDKALFGTAAKLIYGEVEAEKENW
jgi:hypothetical protein